MAVSVVLLLEYEDLLEHPAMAITPKLNLIVLHQPSLNHQMVKHQRACSTPLLHLHLIAHSGHHHVSLHSRNDHRIRITHATTKLR
jgi:hypothetical protein